MNAKAFVDTNILVYAHTDLDPRKQSIAQKLILENDTCISAQVPQELAYVLFKKFGKSWKEIEDVLSNVAEAHSIHTNSESTIVDACRLANTYKYSFYDSLIIGAALECNCITLLSEDMAGGQLIDKSLTIVNPFFLEETDHASSPSYHTLKEGHRLVLR
jgi:predicted nucleic acid-binding protein